MLSDTYQHTFIDVVLPLPLPGTYSYRVPAEYVSQLLLGKRVIVQFGKQKIYSAVIWRIHHNSPIAGKVKEILSVLDEYPVVNEKQMQLWEWIASYYMCSLGDVMSAAMPAALKLQSETRILLHPLHDAYTQPLTDDEYLITEALLSHHALTIRDISLITDRTNVFPLLRTMMDKKLLLAEEEIKEKFKPRLVEYVLLEPQYVDDENALGLALNTLEKKASRQAECLLVFMKTWFDSDRATEGILKSQLSGVTGFSDAAYKALLKKNILVSVKKVEGRMEAYEGTVSAPALLNDIQQQALTLIQTQFEEKQVVLLHGVTSSGKTEVYIHLIQEQLNVGRQVLYLLPEIALTTQIITRLRRIFGNRVGVYHSRYTDYERAEVWQSVLSGKEPGSDKEGSGYDIIIGARSALFLPYSNLGLVLVDEEHENTFKQVEKTPRYHARDAAIVMAGIHEAKVLLGSATPSLESYRNADSGKFGKVIMSERYGGMELPEIVIANLKEAARKKQLSEHFAPLMIDEIQKALGNKKQVILFQNRRGFSPRMECETCNWVPQCINCDVTLTYHKFAGNLRCHYCGYSMKMPSHCSACNDTKLTLRGFGTEKIEEDLSTYFPEARVSRLDLDSVRSRNAHAEIISDFEQHNIDILVGTQMVTKGLDFDHVSMVGILNADNMLSFPDFRAHERSYQLMAQVSGRAGRKGARGKVIIQTYNPAHYILQNLVDGDHQNIYDKELDERMRFKYPPFSRLIELTLKHKDYKTVNMAAATLGLSLTAELGNRVIGPETPYIGKIRNHHLSVILIKIDEKSSPSAVKEIVQKQITTMNQLKDFKGVQVVRDVDPV